MSYFDWYRLDEESERKSQFDRRHARKHDPSTSHEAAASIHITEQAVRVLGSYRRGVPLLDHDAYMHAGFPPNARDGQRCSDLRFAGYIKRTGGRALTPSGKSGYLCCITKAGLSFLSVMERK